MLAIPVLALSLAACSSDPNSIAAQAKSGNRQGYISGDGTIESIPAAKRKKPPGKAPKSTLCTGWPVPA